MFNLFIKKWWYHFYLPCETYYLVKDNNTEAFSNFLKNDKVFFLKLSISNISEKLVYVSIAFKCQEELDKFKSYISRFNEFFPPWVIFPNMFQGAPRWNQGAEEDYGVNTWFPFWKNLDFEQKEEYLLKFSCPIEWRQWLSENS